MNPAQYSMFDMILREISSDYADYKLSISMIEEEKLIFIIVNRNRNKEQIIGSRKTQLINSMKVDDSKLNEDACDNILQQLMKINKGFNMAMNKTEYPKDYTNFVNLIFEDKSNNFKG